MKLSIFAKQAFLNTNPNNAFISKELSYKGNGHLQRVSSMIRGDQIADRIGAKFNPTEGFEDDTCIYVKPMVRKGDDFNFEGKKNYLDIIDGHNLGQLLLKHPEVGCITCSQVDYETMKRSIPNKVVLIPQHHCNFERIIRFRGDIRTVGVIGTESSFDYLPEGLEKSLKERGLNLLKYSKFFSREDIIDFYTSIDIQMVWRPYKKRLSNPLKIVNADSFAVPTIALDEPAFQEVKGSYLPCSDFTEFLYYLDNLIKEPALYRTLAKCGLVYANEYHINKIAKLYKEL